MSSQRSSNVDEMVALAEESLLPKEKERWWASYVVDFAVVCRVPPLAGGVSCPNAIVRVVAGDDGVVPGRLGGGVVDDGAFEDPTKQWDVADGECGAVAVVDELAHVHAPGVADGERGMATTAVL